MSEAGAPFVDKDIVWAGGTPFSRQPHRKVTSLALIEESKLGCFSVLGALRVSLCLSVWWAPGYLELTQASET